MATIYGDNFENSLTATSVTGDTVYGFDANDFLNGNDGNDRLFGGDGLDFLNGNEGNDDLFGEDGNDSLYGDVGNDFLNGDVGNDFLFGGDGFDFLLGGDGTDRIHGEDGNDDLFGEGGDDFLFGDTGDDRLIAGSGDDLLFGGFGNDRLNSGSGEDTFSFDGGVLVSGVDTVQRFGKDYDVIKLSRIGFNLKSKSGEGFSKASEFAVVTGSATTSSALIVYNRTTGELAYNPNGANAGFGTGGGTFAQFREGLNLSATDFEIG